MDFQELDKDGSFDLRKFRAYLDVAARRTNPAMQAICPFGFELFGDNSYLRKELDRIYVLIRFPPDQQNSDISLRFVELLCLLLKTNAPHFFGSIGLVRLDKQNLLRPNNDMSTRILNVRTRGTTISALDDYAYYIMASTDGILSSQLGESAAFESTPRARRRVYQLFRMVEYLVDKCFGLESSRIVLPPPNSSLCEIHDLLADTAINPYSSQDMIVFRDRLIPRLLDIQIILRSPWDGVVDSLNYKIRDLYTDNFIEARLNQSRALTMKDYIVNSYHAFPMKG
jgi:hypothetical protein